MSSPRRSKRAREEFKANTRLRAELQRSSGYPSAMKRMTSVLEAASDADIQDLGSWSPIVRAIIICGSRTTRNGNRPDLEDKLLAFIDVCSNIGILLDAGDKDDTTAQHLERPLHMAAYYGLHRAVQRLIEAGATPDLMNGQGETALHKALVNPMARDRLRRCDKQAAMVLFQQNAVTSSLRVWKDSLPGSKIYTNSGYLGSALKNAIYNRNREAAILLVCQGAVLTDKDWSGLRLRMNESRSLLPFISEITAAYFESFDNSDDAASWREELVWSFPPTWKVTVALCGCCGLQESVFRDHVVPFLSRSWFYSPEQLRNRRLIPRNVHPSMGQLDLGYGGEILPR